MKILGYEIKKSIPIPSNEAQRQYMTVVNSPQWIKLQDVNDDRQFIKYGFNELDVIYSPLTFAADQIASIKIKLKNKDTGEIIENHPLLDLINKPNEYTTKADLISDWYLYKKLCGNSYQFVERMNDNTEPTELYTIPAQYTSALVNNNTGAVYAPILEGWEFQFSNVTFNMKKADVKNWTEPKVNIETDADLFYGQSVFRPMARKIKLDNGAITSSIKFIENGGMRGFLSPKDTDEEVEVSQEFINNTQAKLDSNGTGEYNANKTMVFAIPMDFTDLGSKMVDFQLIDIDKVTLQSVCRTLKFSSILVNDLENSTYDNYRTASQDGYLKAFIPEHEKLIEGWNSWLKPMFRNTENLELCGDYENIPEIQQFRMQQSQSFAPYKNEMSTNEVREKVLGLERKEPSEEGWEYVDYPISERMVMSQLRFYDNGQSEQTSE